MRFDEVKNQKPKVFYKGYIPGSRKRIRTGNNFWDSLFFISSELKQAQNYGTHIKKFIAKPDAKILYEGTKDFRSIAKGLSLHKMNILEWAKLITERAKDAGYDAVWFKMQGNIGTAVINRNAFKQVEYDND